MFPQRPLVRMQSCGLCKSFPRLPQSELWSEAHKGVRSPITDDDGTGAPLDALLRHDFDDGGTGAWEAAAGRLLPDHPLVKASEPDRTARSAAAYATGNLQPDDECEAAHMQRRPPMRTRMP